MEEDWIEQALHGVQDAVTRGLHEGVRSLDAAGVDRVMEAQARACADACVGLFDLPAELGFEEFLERMQLGGSSKVEITREGDTILWDEHHEGQCMCPLVKREVVSLHPSLCVCATHWLQMLVARHTDRDVKVELLDSIATGNPNCTFRITLT